MERMTNSHLPDVDRALIVFDADQLELVGFPDGGVFRMLHSTANLYGHTLAVPQTVAMEHLAHHRFEVQQSTGRSPEEAAQRRHDALHTLLTILPTPEGAAEEALDRVACGRLPDRTVSADGDDGKLKDHAVRDTVVWLTLLDAFEARNQMLWFLSGDRHFAARSAFHPDLRAEAAQRLGTERSSFLGLMTDGIPTLLKRWGTRLKLSAEELNLVVRSDSVAQQVRTVITGPVRPFPPDRVVPSASLLAFDGWRGRPLAYQVHDRLWVPCRIRWSTDGEERARFGSSFIVTRVLLEVSVEPMLVRAVTVLDVSAVEAPTARGWYEA
ncbi:hypothetical protein [Streptomyces graminilatus]|uniref:hypothetical protein n=1 Tax=Streptomyces graminilatus TaxID=1464070 RepID=UPI0006E31425|nr:hypothetical protein [Streptomyces graminilatus]